MKKFTSLLLLSLCVFYYPGSTQNSLNTTLIGHWGYGPCIAVAESGNYA
jgi:hypothetical protein